MEILRYKLPLLMYSNTEHDPVHKSTCLIRNMKDVDISEVHGIENLRGIGYSWIQDYEESYSGGDIERMFNYDKRYYGFNYREVMMDVSFCRDGYCIAEFLTNLPFNTIVSVNSGQYSTTLKEAIKSFLDGHLSDGVGENEIGIVEYNGATYDVWFGEAIEI